MNTVPDYSALSLHKIIRLLQKRASISGSDEIFGFLILDPDFCRGKYAGEHILLDGKRYLCRSWKNWGNLAELLGMRMLTPKPFDAQRLLLRFSRLGTESFHTHSQGEKYEPGGRFSRIRKEEEPAFHHYYFNALQRVKVAKRKRILDLGLNRGDELEPIRRLAGEAFGQMQIIGVDRACDALAIAGRRYPENLQTHCHDLNDLDALHLGRFDLILSIGTLQSPGIEMKPLIMGLVQKHLSPDGALLLGWPNSRWIDGELIYGAKAPNYPFSELSLVIKDLYWIKKYLQQHRFRVVITGREYLFLEATKISRFNGNNS